MTSKRFAATARAFQLADGRQVNTRSSKPHLRRIAKKLARRADKRAGGKR